MNGDDETLAALIFDPNNLVVAEAKIRNYLLDLDHPEGGSKAKLLKARGFADEQWQALDEAVRLHPTENPVEGQVITEWGVKFSVRCSLKTPDGRNPCFLTVWMVDGLGPARFVTARPAHC